MKTHPCDRTFFLSTAALMVLGLAVPAARATGNSYLQTNLDSDLPGEALYTEPDLVNPWGIAESATSPFWVADAGTGLSTLYNSSGVQNTSVVVTVPQAPGLTGNSSPSGVVFNSAGTGTFAGSKFIFDTEQGTIAGWSSGATATTYVNQNGTGADFKGLALAGTGASSYLYATNFSGGTVEVFNSSFVETTLAGNFTDPSLPAGYAPYNVALINGDLYVTYALQNASGTTDVPGLGNGFVDVYSTSGNLIDRLISGGELDAPWGLAVAPADFGSFGGDLLVGNFGNGEINAYNATTGAYAGTLDDSSGNPIDIPGLWALQVGNGGSGGFADDVYFTAGIPGPTGHLQEHGLFGAISAVPDAASTALMLGCALLCLVGAKRYAAKPAA